jgi:hypothetical protein
MPAREHFRAHGRRQVNLGGILHVPAESRVQDVRVHDLGLGGACIELAESAGGIAGLEVEEQVTIEVTAPSLWDPLPLRGKVAWVRRTGPSRRLRAGIRFEHRDSAALYTLFQLLGSKGFET